MVINNQPLATRLVWELEEDEVSPPTSRNTGLAQAVRCNETGHIYQSIRSLCETMCLDRRSVIKQLAGQRVRVGGFTFSRVERFDKETRDIVSFVGNTLAKNELRAIQSIVKSARLSVIGDKLEALGEAAWFLKQEMDKLLVEIKNSDQSPLEAQEQD